MGKSLERLQIEELDRIISHRDTVIKDWGQLVLLGRTVEKKLAEEQASPKETKEAK